MSVVRIYFILQDFTLTLSTLLLASLTHFCSSLQPAFEVVLKETFIGVVIIGTKSMRKNISIRRAKIIWQP